LKKRIWTVLLTLVLVAILAFTVVGCAGEQGLKGPKGDAGAQGIQGEQGEPGLMGSQGEPGVTGAKGSTGAKGATGSKGATGTTGEQGERGPAGVGYAGATGATGAVGPQGPAGEDGEDYNPQALLDLQEQIDALEARIAALEFAKYGTIQAAIDAAVSGATIVVPVGIYNEDVTINKSLTLISAAGKDNTIINGQLGGQAAAVRIADGVSNIVIGDIGQGFTINATGLAAIYVVGSGTGNQNVTICDNKLVAADGQNALLTGGLQLSHTITSNEFTGAASQLVYINGAVSLVGLPSTSVNFINNTFAGTATGPALGQEAADSTISGNTFATMTNYTSLELWVDSTITGNAFTADLPVGGVYVWDNTGFDPGIPGDGVYVIDLNEVLNNNTFQQAVVIENHKLVVPFP